MAAAPSRSRVAAGTQPATSLVLPEPIWKGSPNFQSNRPYGLPIGLVLHTMGGSLAGTDAWFGTSASQVSAHTGVGLQGQRHRYVAYGDRAWSNGVLEAGNLWQTVHDGNPNSFTLSLETEDLGVATTPVSELQYAAVLAEAREMLARYPSVVLLVRHADISPRSRSGCPGPRWTTSGRFAQLSAELGLETL